ncbi:metastasis-associated protein MTA3 [Lingula anatina]|uniref:Metastasis-associated protein MTA3 n=1 Tax=Lingula anatina TaxID=7574 RepID=A0A1S3HPM7_LINAN|nr:metastasis-associated protein MTA3 [Lingula anatina]|eukprot:XP_013387992.1 metastasis-associated protein MTA3 [Lingula anatina]
MAANMYRVGDYVYFETSSTSPYQIRRIEELNKTPNGNVEAKVMCFYRRRDISNSLIMLADKHQSTLEDDQEMEENDDVSEQQRHQLKHRELFLSRQVETLPATHIRGKSTVTLLNETELLASYLNKEDTFFYSLVYDPQQKTLLADKGEIRVGGRYQADVQPLLKEGESDGRKMEDLEELVWNPETHLSDRQIDQFMVIARAVGTFARALDCTSTVRQPSLHMSAAAASRDVTLFHAMDTLHKHQYNTATAISSLVPPGGPVLCRDEMEEWSASEANLFEEALDKYGKDFNDIRQDFLPWKTLKSIVEYYYMWKTTDRYVQQKRIKAAEAESKLKQVYIPNYNKPNPAQLPNNKNGSAASAAAGAAAPGAGGEGVLSRACESCYTAHSSQWYAWGPAHMQCRLCSSCWIYWKKYGGLKMPTRLDGERPAPNQRQERLAQMAALRMHKCTISGCGKEFKLKAHLARHLATAHGLAIRSGSPRPVMKTRAAFCLVTTPLTRISRRVCRDILKPRRAARSPFTPINIAAIKQECQVRLPDAAKNITIKPKPQITMEKVGAGLSLDVSGEHPPWLAHSEKKAEPARYAYPRPSAEELNQFWERQHVHVEEEEDMEGESPSAKPSIMKKRGYDQGGLEGPPAKRPTMGVIRQSSSIKQRGPYMNGRGKPGTKATRKLNWVDAPDDVFFLATDNTRRLRKQLNGTEFRKAARKPWRVLENVKWPSSTKEQQEPIVILD